MHIKLPTKTHMWIHMFHVILCWKRNNYLNSGLLKLDLHWSSPALAKHFILYIFADVTHVPYNLMFAVSWQIVMLLWSLHIQYVLCCCHLAYSHIPVKLVVAIQLNMLTAWIINEKNYCISTCTNQSSSVGTPLGERSACTFEQTMNYIMKLTILLSEDRKNQQTKQLQFMHLWHLTSKHCTSGSLYLPLPLPGLVGVWFLCEALLCPPEPLLSGIPTRYEHAQCLFPNLHSAQITLTSSLLWRPCLMQVPIKTMKNKCFRAYHQNTWIYPMSQSLFFLQF